jgi:hypothetical protein
MNLHRAWSMGKCTGLQGKGLQKQRVTGAQGDKGTGSQGHMFTRAHFKNTNKKVYFFTIKLKTSHI